MDKQRRAELVQVLTKFLRDANKEGTIGHGLQCIDTAIASIESLFEAERADRWPLGALPEWLKLEVDNDLPPGVIRVGSKEGGYAYIHGADLYPEPAPMAPVGERCDAFLCVQPWTTVVRILEDKKFFRLCDYHYSRGRIPLGGKELVWNGDSWTVKPYAQRGKR